MVERTFDPGAQNERTALAWTRTGLALLIGLVLATRIAASSLGVLALAFGVVLAPMAVVVLVPARRRYLHAHRALHTDEVLPDGRLPAVVTLATLVLAALEITYALS